MNGVALVIALASWGVDYSHRTTEDGQIEYTIQIEQEFLKSLASGEEIHSDVPPEAGDVQRVCIRIGTAPVKHTAASIQQFKRLLVAAPRYASADPALAGGDAQRTIFWPARTNPEETFGVQYGWQPDPEGQLAYYVQIEPTVLRTLAAGDEIHAAIDPAAGKVGRFVVVSGTQQLPRVSPAPAAAAPLPLAKGGTRFQTGDDTPPLLTNVPAIGGGRTGDVGPVPSGSAAANGAFSSTQPRFNSTREQPVAELRAPPLVPPTNGYAGAALETSRGDYGQMPLDRSGTNYYPQAGAAPANDPRGYAPAPSADPGRYDRQQPGSIQPPPDLAVRPSFVQPTGGQQQPPQYQQPYQPPPYAEPTTRYSPQTPTDRFAAATSPTVTPTTIGSTAAATALPPARSDAPAATPVSASPTGSMWLVVLFLLCFSVGGNLYLGYTAAEFYSRYRLAVDRLRTAART